MLSVVTASDAVLHRIEALPGDRRYAVTFRRGDGGEQTAVAQLSDAGVEMAEASLPVGWAAGSDIAQAAFDAIVALDAARRVGGTGTTLRDVDGGWDVGLGNVVLGADDAPTCTAHGALAAEAGVWTCPECGARALYG